MLHGRFSAAAEAAIAVTRRIKDGLMVNCYRGDVEGEYKWVCMNVKMVKDRGKRKDNRLPLKYIGLALESSERNRCEQRCKWR